MGHDQKRPTRMVVFRFAPVPVVPRNSVCWLKSTRSGRPSSRRPGGGSSRPTADHHYERDNQLSRTDISNPPLNGSVIVRKRCAGSLMKAKYSL